MQLFDELKRRNVFRVALAYLVAAWLLIQVVDIVSDVLELPAWTPKLILLLLAIGFVVALIVSWAYEITPEGIKKEKDVDRDKSITNITAKKLDKITIALLLMVVAMVIVDRNYDSPHATISLAQVENTNPQQAIKSSANSNLSQALLDTKAVAVIPFANRSNKKDDEFFTDGIHDDLLTHISRIKDLKVISRTSVMKYRNSNKSIPEIAQELGVGAILEGGVQRAGDRIRVNVQLIDANTDQHIWAEIYDHTLTVENLFAIQSQITESIAAALKAQLSDTEKELIADVPTQSLEAYDLYLLGRQYFHQRSTSSLPRAIELFEKAIELDPEFGLAYSGLADSYSLIFQYADFDPEVAIPKSYEYAKKAVELAPEMAESWASLGLISAIRQDDEIFEYYKKALEINPNYSMAYVWLGNGYVGEGQFQMALQTFEKNYEIDPAHPLVMENLIDMYLTVGDYENAEKFIRRSLKLEPDFILTYPQVIRFYSSKGNLVDAYKVARYAHNKAPDSPVILENYIDIETNLGNFESAQYLVNKMKAVASRSSRGAITEVMLAVEQERPSDEVLVVIDKLREKFRRGPPRAFLDQMKAYLLFKQQKYSDSLDAHPQNLPFKGMEFFGAILKALSYRSLDKTDEELEELAKARVIVNEEQEQEAIDEFSQESLALMLAAEGKFDASLSTLNIAFDRGYRRQGHSALWPLFEVAFSKSEEAAQRFEAFKKQVLDDISRQQQLIASASKQCNDTPDNCPLDEFSLKPD
ncbi:MAG: hypothetical protein HWE16_03405 [Gammaproteobacteria bacterium]|nr:hypothetical protein [Gammaproteobacteria bacterium]